MTGLGVDEADLCAYCAGILVNARRFFGTDGIEITDFDGGNVECKDWSTDTLVESVQLGYTVRAAPDNFRINKAIALLDGSRVCGYHAWYLTKDDLRR